jgi:hypothetical protein
VTTEPDRDADVIADGGDTGEHAPHEAPEPAVRGTLSPAPVWAWVMGGIVAALFSYQVLDHAIISDDSYISFRYAHHLADGRGLTWNTGEWVEGYTNFSWVVLLALGFKLGVTPEVLAPTMGIACGAILLGLVVRFSARRLGWKDPLIWVAPLAMAANRSYAAWATSGLETQLFALLAFAAVITFIAEDEAKPKFAWRSSLLLGLATLTRPDGGVFAIALGLLYVLEVARRRRSFTSLLLWVAPAAAIVAAHVAFRMVYYGYPVPNTFYAKVGGVWTEQTIRYFTYFFEDYKLHWFSPLMLVALVGGFRSRAHGVFGFVLITYLAYLARIGGDFLEFRFFVPAMAFGYWLVQDGIRVLRDLTKRAVAALLKQRAKLVPHVFGFVVAAPLAVLLLGITIEGSRSDRPAKKREGMSSLHTIREFARSRAAQGIFLAELIEAEILPADLRIATLGAGALPYYCDLFTVDVLGLNDEHIAHTEIAGTHLIGHQKVGTNKYLRERFIDMVDIGPGEMVTPAVRLKFAGERRRIRWYHGPVHVVRVRGRYLQFGTHLTPQEFRDVFGHLDIIY